MNNQIDELAIQAGAKIETAHWVYYDDFSYQKFAELIIRECATAIINDRRLNDVRSAANGCVRTINEHFGVE